MKQSRDSFLINREDPYRDHTIAHIRKTTNFSNETMFHYNNNDDYLRGVVRRISKSVNY